VHSPSRPRRRGVSGVTLIELLVALAVLAILATMAAPALSEMMWSSRLTAQADKIVTSLQRARSEAIYRRQAVALKGFIDRPYPNPCTQSATGGFDWTNLTTFVDAAHRHNLVPVPDPAGKTNIILEQSSVQRTGLYGQDPATPSLFLVSSTACAIVFHGDGMPRALASAKGGETMQSVEVIVCRPNALPAQNVRRIQMTAGGRIRVVKDSGQGRCPSPG
jgi:type IV fimbrial biogenesis protein FimT